MESIKVYADNETLQQLDTFLLNQPFDDEITIETKFPTVVGQSNEVIDAISSIFITIKGYSSTGLFAVLGGLFYKFYSKNKKDLYIKSDGKEIKITNLSFEETEKIISKFKNL